MLKKTTFLLSCLYIAAHCSAQLPALNPVADNAAIVAVGNARFTVLTPSLIRMEWDLQKHFNDKATQVFINRHLAVPSFTSRISNNVLVLKTDSLVLRYVITDDSFTADNVTISSAPVCTVHFKWKPGQTDSLNLKGTMRTLDGKNGGSLSMLENGILSQSGWAVVNDSRSYLFNGDTAWDWLEKTPRQNCQDWYFFGYGRNYKKALYDFTQVAGKIPLPPNYAFGYWWSRYWIYSQQELEDLVKTFKSLSIPIDVVIIDMDWHNTYGLRGNACINDGQGSIVGWTGYTWNKNLFPYPEKLLDWMEQNHIKNALNLHPSSGISPMEEKYAAFAQAYHFDTAGRRYIPYNGSDKLWADIYFDSIIHPLERLGVDFWWLDWQQFPYDPHYKTLSNTWWLNYLFFTDMEKQGKRPLLFHRWGGLGNHRYQVGFSGDTYISWQSLAFQPAFTATAANVGYGYWSHDIGGHQYNDSTLVNVKNHELFLRWMQFGVFSPILRTHATKRAEIERRIWMYGADFLPLKRLIQLRYSLYPYIYTACRNTYDSGISLCHPLYYEYPFRQNAYIDSDEYYFGNDIIVAPVCKPVDTSSGLAMQKVWLPPGKWEEWFTGTTLHGGTYNRTYTRYDIPVFVRSGSIIPMYSDNVQTLQQPHDTIVLMVFTGNGSGSLYEDDGSSEAYKNGHYATTNYFQKVIRQSGGKKIEFVIYPRVGSYTGMQSGKRYIIRFYKTYPFTHIAINGVEQVPDKQNIFYDGQKLEQVICLPVTGCKKKIVITAVMPSYPDKVMQGAVGQFKRTDEVTDTLKNAVSKVDWAAGLPDKLFYLQSIPQLITYRPDSTYFYLKKFQEQVKALPRIINDIPDLQEKDRQKAIRLFKIK